MLKHTNPFPKNRSQPPAKLRQSATKKIKKLPGNVSKISKHRNNKENSHFPNQNFSWENREKKACAQIKSMVFWKRNRQLTRGFFVGFPAKCHSLEWLPGGFKISFPAALANRQETFRGSLVKCWLRGLTAATLTT